MVNVWIVISWGSCLRLASSCVRLICGPALPALFFLWISTSFSGIAHLLDQGLSWVLLLLLYLQIHLGLLMSLVFLLCLWGFFSVFMCLWSYYILLHFEGSAGSSYVLDLITLSFEVFWARSFHSTSIFLVSVFLREWRQRTTACFFLPNMSLPFEDFEQY